MDVLGNVDFNWRQTNGTANDLNLLYKSAGIVIKTRFSFEQELNRYKEKLLERT